MIRLRSITSALVVMMTIGLVLLVDPHAAAAAAGGGSVRLVSHSGLSPTTAGAGTSDEAVPTADGAFVVFASTAGNLVPGQIDGNGTADVFLLERATGTVTLVSHTPGSPTAAGSDASRSPSISDDGAFVVFTSNATDLVAGQSDSNGGPDVFLFERATGTVTLVSHAAGSATTTANSESAEASISDNGAFVTFASAATNLVPGQMDANGAADVFLFERATTTVALVSHAPGSPTTTGNNSSSAPTISEAGGFVAFTSAATNLVAGQTDASIVTSDVFLFSRATQAVSLVSHTPASVTTTANGTSAPDAVTETGPFVVFRSTAPNLVAGQSDPNGGVDVFLFDGATQAVTLVSHAAGSATTAANGISSEPSISEDAAFVAFQSFATNLVAGQTDANENFDVFLFERATGNVTLVSHVPASAFTTANDESTDPSISADGGFVAFRSLATDLVPGQGDISSTEDVFLFRRASGAVSLVSHPPAATTTAGNGNSTAPAISANGAYVTFVSLATNLVAGQSDTNDAFDVFLFKRTVPPADVDGDGDTDISVYRPANGIWFFRDGPTLAWGATGDIPVPGDYDGDGDTDVAVYRPANGVWFIQGGPTVAWGASEDIPVPGDYDGDGDTDIAVFRPSTGVWFIQGGPAVAFGTAGDIPVPGDYDGDGDTEVAVFRPSSGVWFIQGGPAVAF
ncbi:MAG: hypothetical protein M3179_08675, partial [Actinomycetota bacterium]|nr:hypothetical protein [Actinomycetota bacterium]